MATLTVTTNADSGSGSLRQAIADAASGDTITFDSTLAGSTITLASKITLVSGVKIVGLVDANGAPAVTLSGSDTYSFTDTVVAQIEIENLVFSHFYGVVVFSDNSAKTATFKNCYFFDNTRGTRYGGALVFNNGDNTLTFTDCKFERNTTTGSGGTVVSGGAIFIRNNYDYSTSVITRCVFNANKAGSSYGGAVYLETGVLEVYDSTFSNNETDGQNTSYFAAGGAIASKRSTSVAITRCVFTNNELKSQLCGGAIFLACTSSVIEDCTFNGNSAVNSNDLAIGTYGTSFSSTTLVLSGNNDLKGGFYVYDVAGKTHNIQFSGYSGISDLTTKALGTINYSGSGHVALPSSVSVTLPATITRSEYGAGVSNISATGAAISWSSTDATKSVLIQKESGGSWTDVSTTATSPFTASENGTYRIWDGATFLTISGVIVGPTTYIVTNTNDSGTGSLRAALAVATSQDTVTFDASLAGSTITLSSGLTLSDAAKIVGLVDANGDPAITISGAGSYRILSGNYPMTLSNLVFTNAGDHAIYNEDADGSSFVNCVFSNNSATDTQGGAVYIEGTLTETDAATFTNCVFSGNTSVFSTVEGTAGALFIQRLNVVLTDCDFTNNTAEGDEGGAIVFFGNTTLTIDGCNFTGNSVAAKSASTGAYMGDVGGAIYSSGEIIASDCTFTNNSVNNPYDGDKGGAVFTASYATFTDCTFSNNSATDNGGAIYSHSTTTLSGCSLSGNTATNGADFYGGGLSVQAGVVTIPNVYIASGSTVSIANGAALSCSNSATILGTVSATTRGYLATPPGTDLSGATLTNIVACDYGAGVSAFSIDEDSADWTAAHSNISVLLEKKVNGAWQTLAQPTGTSYSTTFSDGDEARIFDGVQFRTASAVVPQTLIVTNTNPTGAGSLAQAVIDARAVDTITFDPSLAGETITLNAGLWPRNEVTIVGLTDSDGNPAITVDGNGNYTFNSSYPVHVSNVAFNGGWGAFSSNGGFDGSTFENCTFENMDLNVFELSNSSQTAESVSFTDCVFSSNDAADMLVTGNVNATLNGGNVLSEGFDLTDAETVVITNAGYNGVGGYTAPTTGTASVAGSGNIALPPAAVVTTAATVTRSDYGALISDASSDSLTINWDSADSTKSVLLEKQNGSDWDFVDDDATSPTTVSTSGTYRLWDGINFLTVIAEKKHYWIISSGAISGNVWRVKAWAATRGDE